MGTDIDTRFLNEIREPNFKAWKHDITIDDLPTGEFDLVHTRWLLQHLAEPEAAIQRMITAVRPGGWLLVEGMDFFSDPHLFLTTLHRSHGWTGGCHCLVRGK